MNIKLYYHKTDGGAEYLTDTFIKWSHNGKSGKEGTTTAKTKYSVRIDGDITKDAEITGCPEYRADKGPEIKKEKELDLVLFDTLINQELNNIFCDDPQRLEKQRTIIEAIRRLK